MQSAIQCWTCQLFVVVIIFLRSDRLVSQPIATKQFEFGGKVRCHSVRTYCAVLIRFNMPIAMTFRISWNIPISEANVSIGQRVTCMRIAFCSILSWCWIFHCDYWPSACCNTLSWFTYLCSCHITLELACRMPAIGIVSYLFHLKKLNLFEDWPH